LQAQLIKKVWLEDPLLCPDCKGEMRIVSFITDPPVVDKIPAVRLVSGRVNS